MDLISRQAAINALDDVLVEDDSCKVWFKLTLKQLPSAERLGRWILNQNIAEPLFKCSSCGTAQGRVSRYCPNCGAKMDEVEE